MRGITILLEINQPLSGKETRERYIDGEKFEMWQRKS